jgi:hypothetical protein
MNLFCNFSFNFTIWLCRRKENLLYLFHVKFYATRNLWGNTIWRQWISTSTPVFVHMQQLSVKRGTQKQRVSFVRNKGNCKSGTLTEAGKVFLMKPYRHWG